MNSLNPSSVSPVSSSFKEQLSQELANAALVGVGGYLVFRGVSWLTGVTPLSFGACLTCSLVYSTLMFGAKRAYQAAHQFLGEEMTKEEINRSQYADRSEKIRGFSWKVIHGITDQLNKIDQIYSKTFGIRTHYETKDLLGKAYLSTAELIREVVIKDVKKMFNLSSLSSNPSSVITNPIDVLSGRVDSLDAIAPLNVTLWAISDLTIKVIQKLKFNFLSFNFTVNLLKFNAFLFPLDLAANYVNNLTLSNRQRSIQQLTFTQ